MRIREMIRPLTILVEGNIGAGKTLFLQRFKGVPNIQVLQEPVDRWRNVNGNNLLQLMYQDPARWSLAFQTFVQLTMLEQHMLRESEVKLMERSIYSARYCFVELQRQYGNMQDSEYQVLNSWFDFLKSSTDFSLGVDLIVYLKTSPEVAYERLKRRQRGEEHLISLQYIQDLHKLHDDWLLHHRFPLPAPVLVVDGDKDQSELETEFIKLNHIILKEEKRKEERAKRE